MSLPAPLGRRLAVPGLGRLLQICGYALFFLMLFVPTTYQPIKGGLLIVVLGGIAVASLVTNRIRIALPVGLSALAFATFGLTAVLHGAAAGAPGALQMLNVYVTWPVVFTVLAAGASYPGVLRGLCRTLVAATFAIATYSIVYVLWSAGWWPDPLYVAIDQGQAIGFYGTYIEFNLYSITSLLFVAPYLLGALFLFPRDDAPVRRSTLWVATALCMTTVLLTGRRGLLVVVPMAPVFALIFRSWLTPRAKQETRQVVRRAAWAALALTAVLVAIITAVGGMAPAGFVDMVASGFRFESDPVAMLRRDQYVALVTGWLGQPLFGSGHGTAAPGMIRSLEAPWSYELTYLALLYHTGAVGLAAYAAGIAWMLLSARRAAQEGWRGAPYLLAVLTGTASFLVANATNPYLEKYDYIWVVFLPLAFINAWMTDAGRRPA